MFPRVFCIVFLLCLNISEGNEATGELHHESFTLVAIQQRQLRTGSGVSVLNQLLIGQSQKSYSVPGSKKSPTSLDSAELSGFNTDKPCNYDKNDALDGTGMEIKSSAGPNDVLSDVAQQMPREDHESGRYAKKQVAGKDKLNHEKDYKKVGAKTENYVNPHKILGKASSAIYKIVANGRPSQKLDNRGLSSLKTEAQEKRRPLIGVAQTKTYRIIDSRSSAERFDPLGSRKLMNGSERLEVFDKSPLTIQGEGVPMKIPAHGDKPPVILYVSKDERDRILAENPNYGPDSPNIYNVSRNPQSGWNRMQNEQRWFNRLPSGRKRLATTGQAQKLLSQPTALKFVSMKDSSRRSRILAGIVKRKLAYGPRPVQLRSKARNQNVKVVMNERNPGI